MFVLKTCHKVLIASSVLVLASIQFVSTIFAAPQPFKDVKQDSFYEQPVNYLVGKKVVSGYGDNTFRPNQTITRAEVASMLSNMLQLHTSNLPSSPFRDVMDDKWYAKPIVALVSEGIVTGYEDRTFRPNQTISRAEMAKMLVESYKDLHTIKNKPKIAFGDVPRNQWYSKYVETLVESGVTTGTSPTTFSPNDRLTRAQAATFIYRAHKEVENQSFRIININGACHHPKFVEICGGLTPGPPTIDLGLEVR